LPRLLSIRVSPGFILEAGEDAKSFPSISVAALARTAIAVWL
jgi:hypothetical protein